VTNCFEQREEARLAAREASRALDEADELLRRASRRIELRSGAPEEGQAAVRRARVEAGPRSRRRLAERADHERAERELRLLRLRTRGERCRALAPTLSVRRLRCRRRPRPLPLAADALSEQLAADEAVGQQTAAELRAVRD
jgi:chromosome segregation protein